MRTRLLSGLTALAAGLIVSVSPALPAGAAEPEHTVVSMTFDDGLADQMTAKQIMDNHGMDGTFYINSALIGDPGYMTRADLDALAAGGHEIGGHTVSHQSLVGSSAAEANRQVCNDRNTLLDWGFAVTSFAYPYADVNSEAKAVVQNCGYNTGRGVGDLWSPDGCHDCDLAESIPPRDVYATRTPDEVTPSWTLTDLQNTVRNAESVGGWVAFNYHKVCDGCGANAISPALFNEFLDWLATRAELGTVVKPVNGVVTGPVQPAVPSTPTPEPGGPGVNMVQNPSLEMPTPPWQSPSCWTRTGYGTNNASFNRTLGGHSGTYAGRLRITQYTSGDAKVVPTFDLGTCSLPVAEGHRYTASTWYRSNIPVSFTFYKRDSVGKWSYWGHSPRFAASNTWRKAEWAAPTVPDGMVAASFGLTIDAVGTVYTDDYAFAESEPPTPAPPGVNALKNPSLETAGADVFPYCWAGVGYGTNEVSWSRVTDASDGNYAARLAITSLSSGDAKLIPTFDAENCAPVVNNGAAYAFGTDYKATAPVFFTLYRQALDGTWSYWTQSPTFAATSTYTRATWTAPPVPDGTRAVSFGMTLDAVGTLTTDNYTMVDTS